MSTAQACSNSSTSCTVIYYGLKFTTSGKSRAEIDTTTTANNLKVKDFQNSGGDQERVQSPFRKTDTSGDSMYIKYHVYYNGSYCYISSIGVSAGPGGGGGTVGQGCTSGWHDALGISGGLNGPHIKSRDWTFQQFSWPPDSRGDSTRIVIQPCQDESHAPDECGGTRMLGISY